MDDVVAVFPDGELAKLLTAQFFRNIGELECIPAVTLFITVDDGHDSFFCQISMRKAVQQFEITLFNSRLSDFRCHQMFRKIGYGRINFFSHDL